MGERFKKILAQALLLGTLTNTYILSLLLYLGLYNAIWSPIVGIIIFLIGYFLLNKNNATLIFLIAAHVVIIEIFIHTHFLGWDTGFYYYMFLLPTVFLIGAKWKKWIVIFFYSSILISTITLVAIYINKNSYSPVSTELVSYINLCNFSLTGAVVILVISYFSRTVHKKETELLNLNTKLVKQNNKVINQHENLQVLMKEIHHRVKNNLQMVNSLLRLQASSIKDKNVAELFKDSRQRILSMAKLHEKMYSSDDLQHIDIYEHFKSLINGLLSSYATDKQITLDLKIKDANLEIDTLIPLGLMINEIVTNSLKYAFINQKKGIIKLHLQLINKNEYEMIIGDNGVGVNIQAAPNGLGSKLIKTFTKQLNGSIEQLNTDGTIFKVIFTNQSSL